jgi:transcriptional regulator with XRE-family HTH domain
MGRKPKARRDPYGAWLHYLRTESNLTQEEVAALTGIPQTTITTWERTGTLPGRTEIVLLAKTYRVPIQKLLRSDQVERQSKKHRVKAKPTSHEPR